jgi:adenine-specific DNA methylase
LLLAQECLNDSSKRNLKRFIEEHLTIVIASDLAKAVFSHVSGGAGGRMFGALFAVLNQIMNQLKFSSKKIRQTGRMLT